MDKRLSLQGICVSLLTAWQKNKKKQNNNKKKYYKE